MRDHEIIELYWARNESAIAATAEKYGNYCHTIAYNILRNKEDAEECANDTYQSTHIYRVSGVVVYKRKKYAVCGKGRAELPEPDFACRSFRPVGILLGSAFPKPCFILRLLIGSRFPKSLRASLLTVCISCGFLTEIRVVSCSVCQLPLFTLGHLLVLKKERFSDTI